MLGSGMSSALNGAGGGGLLNTHQSTNANVAIYSSGKLNINVSKRMQY